MAGEWSEISLRELRASTENAMATGPFGSSIGSRFFTKSGVPVIRGSNLSQDVGIRLNDVGLVFLSPDKAQAFSRSTVRNGDLIFTCWGTVNQVGLIDDRAAYREYIISNKQMKLTPDPEKADSLFLYYLLSGPIIQNRIQTESIGSSVPGFNLGQLGGLRISIPGLSEQRAIAHILGTLDDKIELNRRMSETLEAMARALFKSWFVDFEPVRAKMEGRDPGLPKHLADHFPDRLVDSELGEIPEGWEVGTLGDIAVHPRRTVSPNKIAPGTAYIALEHMPRRCIALSSWGIADGLESNKFAFDEGEILFGKLRPYFHKVGVAPINGVCSTDIVVIAPRVQHWFGLALGHLMSDEFVAFTNASSTGTKMPRTTWGEMSRYSIVLPPKPVARVFSDFLKKQSERIAAAIHESRNLTGLRDTLLPELISGELRVKDPDRFSKGSAA